MGSNLQRLAGACSDYWFKVSYLDTNDQRVEAKYINNHFSLIKIDSSITNTGIHSSIKGQKKGCNYTKTYTFRLTIYFNSLLMAPNPMQKYLCFTAILFFWIIGIHAQNFPDCRSAIPVCADAPIMSFADGGGDIDDFDPDVIRESGCLEKGSVSSANIENNTSWYVFVPAPAGK